MQGSSRERVYTESVGAKVTPEVAQAVETAALVAGVKPGEWVRRVIGDALEAKAESRVVLAEVMALRSILLTAEMDARLERNGSAEAFDGIVREADARRFAMADGRIAKAAGQ